MERQDPTLALAGIPPIKRVIWDLGNLSYHVGTKTLQDELHTIRPDT